MSSTLYVSSAIVHNSVATIIRAKTIILRQRKRLAITADHARAAWTAFESDDSDMEAQIGTVLSYPVVFNGEYWNVIDGCVVGGDKLWKTALIEFVEEVRDEFGMLHGEPWPPVEPNGLAFFLRRQAC
ncbi:hypothetical protein [Paraburkholderia rhynchosiae]|uniref:Uncharacterized protein n=1 Tax=Paraburkholderia rhynchosiae TaxID=487049 RepID=A0A2N7WD58_9BURK|nr:hypothetical protein [Paraburkholderia rhynchosiae]PMS27314.1 hypothetical protein C0Z16_25140 [Paraburkholderia rhynchosiae]CAB3744325.1 hypothetical protein LMG27174_07157 [Paraburkholderia rhynchosiae]